MEQATLGQLRIDNYAAPLNEFVIMCAACKRIRGDNGSWRRVELYAASYDRKDISHGICPECARVLYPDYYHH